MRDARAVGQKRGSVSSKTAFSDKGLKSRRIIGRHPKLIAYAPPLAEIERPELEV